MKSKKLAIFFLHCLLITKGQAEVLPEQSPEDIAAKRLALQQRLSDVEKRYGETVATLKNLEQQIEQTRRTLSQNQQDRQSYQKELQKHRKELAGQVKSAYIMGQKEKLKIMLKQQDPMLSTRMMMYYNYINKARLKELNDIQTALKYQGQLDQQNESESKRLKQTLEQKQNEQLALDEAKQQRNELLEQLMTDYSSKQQQLNDLKQSETDLKGLLAALQNGITDAASGALEFFDHKIATPKENAENNDFASLQGKLLWPVNGSVKKFGSAREKGIREGVLIHASEGMDVKAVANGKVVYADPFQSYGSLIIVNHGQDYMTVYGFNQSLYKRVGDSVTAGDVIATVGKSGGRKHAGLYFAIRKQGTPMDPFSWCIKPTK